MFVSGSEWVGWRGVDLTPFISHPLLGERCHTASVDLAYCSEIRTPEWVRIKSHFRLRSSGGWFGRSEGLSPKSPPAPCRQR